MVELYRPDGPITDEERHDCGMLYRGFNLSSPMVDIVRDICLGWKTKFRLERVHRINLFDRLILAWQTVEHLRGFEFELPIQPLNPELLRSLLHSWWLQAEMPPGSSPLSEMPNENWLPAFLHERIPFVTEMINDSLIEYPC